MNKGREKQRRSIGLEITKAKQDWLNTRRPLLPSQVTGGYGIGNILSEWDSTSGRDVEMYNGEGCRRIKSKRGGSW